MSCKVMFWTTSPELTHPETPFLDHATLIEVAGDILPNKPKGEALIIRHLVAVEVSMLGMETWNLKCKADGSKHGHNSSHNSQISTYQFSNFKAVKNLSQWSHNEYRSTVLHFSMDFLAQSLEGQPQKGTRQKHRCWKKAQVPWNPQKNFQTLHQCTRGLLYFRCTMGAEIHGDLLSSEKEGKTDESSETFSLKSQICWSMICFEYVWIHKVQTLQTCGQTGHLEVIGLQGLFVEGEALTLVDGNPWSSSWSSRQKKERIAPSILKESHFLTARNSGVSIATSIYLDSTEISIGKREKKRQGLEGSRVHRYHQPREACRSEAWATPTLRHETTSEEKVLMPGSVKTYQNNKQ